MRREQAGSRVEGNTPASLKRYCHSRLIATDFAAKERKEHIEGKHSSCPCAYSADILWRAPRCRRRAHEDATVTTLLRPTAVSPRLPSGLIAISTRSNRQRLCLGRTSEPRPSQTGKKEAGRSGRWRKRL